MKVVIAGGTGFLGQPLVRSLAAEGHEVVVLTRHSHPTPRSEAGAQRHVAWTPGDEGGAWTRELEGAGAVVNLAGESIAAQRWSSTQKQRILESRLRATRSLAQAIRAAGRTPGVFVSGSAVGYYGPLGDEIVTEDHPSGNDFLATVCAQWESAAIVGVEGTTRVACIRTGLVLARDGGALPRMVTPVKLGVGGPLGSGRQYMPWIHRADWVALVRWTIDNPSVTGAINATAPSPATNADFTRALGRALHRPAFMPAPAFALRLLLGEMAEGLLLSGQRAIPAKAQRLGFTFRYADLDEALRAIFA